MSEESPITNPELYEAIDENIGNKTVEVVKKRGRKTRKKQSEDYPEGLLKMTGKDVMEALDFLHRRYLSWITEAEASKYAVVYKSAKEDVLKEVLELNAELMKQNQQILQELHNLVEKLRLTTGELKLIPTAIKPQDAMTTEQAKSLLDDPRVRTLTYILMETLLGNRKEYQLLKPFVAQILLPEAFEQKSSEQAQAQPQQQIELTPEQKKQLEKELEDVMETIEDIVEEQGEQ